MEYYDPDEPKRVTRGRLPHWWQPGRVCFITFRLHDSVPVGLGRNWNIRRRDWLIREGGFPASWATGDMIDALHEPLRGEYHRRFTTEFERYLDRGLGGCLLRDPRFARILGDGIEHFDGERYELVRYVVMPNHAHVMVGLLGEWDPETLARSWKKWAAGQINDLRGVRGRVFQKESFDPLVRSPERGEGTVRYIERNPERANLPEGAYLLGP